MAGVNMSIYPVRQLFCSDYYILIVYGYKYLADFEINNALTDIHIILAILQLLVVIIIFSKMLNIISGYNF